MKLRFCFWLAVGSHVTLGISLTHVIFVLNFLNCNEHIKNNFSEKKKRMQKMNLIFQYEKGYWVIVWYIVHFMMLRMLTNMVFTICLV